MAHLDWIDTVGSMVPHLAAAVVTARYNDIARLVETHRVHLRTRDSICVRKGLTISPSDSIEVEQTVVSLVSKDPISCLYRKHTSATLSSKDLQPLKVATATVRLRQSILNSPSEESQDESIQQMLSSSDFALPYAEHREIVVVVFMMAGRWYHIGVTLACSPSHVHLASELLIFTRSYILLLKM